MREAAGYRLEGLTFKFMLKTAWKMAGRQRSLTGVRGGISS